jgi:hypothetical protein
MQCLEQFQQFDTILLFVVKAIAPCQGSGVLKMGEIAVDQLRTLIIIIRQKLMRVAVNPFDRVVADKL